MTPRKFHLGWFMNFTPDDWNTPLASGGMPWDGQFYIEMARNLERACFDYMMIEDTLMVSEAYGGSMDAYLKHAIMAPKHDPAPLAAILALSTSKLGIVATMSTSFYPPFMLAQGSHHRLRRQVLQVPRPAEYRAVAAGPPDLRAGRRLASRPGVRVTQRRLDYRHRHRH